MTEKKRFVYYPFSRAIKDRETRWDYEGNQDTADFLNRLSEENEHIKHTIQTMLKNERTHIGRNTLQQLWEAIQ